MIDTSAAAQRVNSASTIDELADLMDTLPEKANSTVQFGLKKSGKKARQNANREAIELLKRVGNDHSLLSEEDKNTLKSYTGKGGIGGSVHEYFTPDFIAKGVWDAMQVNGFENGNVGEPSAGAGVFNATKPKGTIITASEMDATSSQINQLLHPEDKVFNKTFEQMVQNVPDAYFDAMTGNVPFSRSRSTAYDDPEYSNIKQAERYFITRMIDKTKPMGLICCVVPTQIIDRKSWSNWREDISRKAEFLGAHRLPEGTFKDNGTDVPTDVIMLRKHSEEVYEAIKNLDDKTLENANVLWQPFINGQYFKTAEGKKFIHGDVAEGKDRFGNITTTVKNDGRITQKALQGKLARRFDSRIDFDAINTATPVIRNYSEGDQRKINGRWYELVEGQWEVLNRSNSNAVLDVKIYGVKSELEAKAILEGGIEALQTLSFEQVGAILEDYSHLLDSDSTHRGIELYEFSKKLKPQYRERVFKGSLIGEQIIQLQDIANKYREAPKELTSHIRGLVEDHNAQYGIACNDSSLSLLAGKNSNAWNAFSNSTLPTGDLSALLRGTLNLSENVDFDTSNAAHVVSQLYLQFDLNPIPFDEFNKIYTGKDKPKSISEIALLDGVAITPEGGLMPFSRATSGEVVKTAKYLNRALATETDSNIIANIERQLEEIERKRNKKEAKDIEFTLKSKWLPRKYILEFLKQNGYPDFSYVKAQVDEDGNDYIEPKYEGEDGVFTGYTQHADGKKRSSSASISFERQLEKHLNGLSVTSSNKGQSARYKERIGVIEQQFGDWLRQHDDADQITDKFNDTFNGYIPFEHSEHDLGLTNVSENIKLLSYQNSGIRRASEDGRGIIAYGTGLGKTFTALGLEAYNREQGRAKRTCIVVPKAVLENWYHEIVIFYGRGNMSNILIPSVSPVVNQEGEVEQEPVLDDNGEQVVNKYTNKPTYRDKITVKTDYKEIESQLASIPQSNYSVVVLTKEQFARLPIRPESIMEHVSERVDIGAMKGKFKTDAKNYTEAQKNENFKAKYSDLGTQKWKNAPYFEDMGFDNIIVDEGHNYRNSYEAGYKTGQLAYLPTSPASQFSIDMALKSEYLRKKNGGRGTVLLTATPTVNSPTDIYNMLSHVISPQEWVEMGIADIDDFIEIYGETGLENITKLSGEIEEKEALIGFKNLSGLRNLFHRWVNLKDAKSVQETVQIPKLIESKVNVPLSEEQQAIYEELRQKADALNDNVKTVDVTLPDGTVAQMDIPNEDTTFGIIRDMDRVATDIDLYKKTMTFLLPENTTSKVKALIDELPAEIQIGGDKNEPVYATHNATHTIENGTVKLVVHEAYEALVLTALKSSGIKETDISHPVPPKYARMIELMRTGMKDGKQIIFTEEKSQHGKLKRIISHQLGIKPAEIGIINADTTNGKKNDDDQDAGLEAIATAYNTGKHRVLIANKKAEVGINLHHGTTDLYHLTLPWTPASIKQRNGRGARVGSKAKHLRVHYMLGEGSFDEFRLSALTRKAEWMTNLFTSDDDKLKNEDSSLDSSEMSLLLAADPEERAERDKLARKTKEAKIRADKKRIALVDVSNFIKASHDSKFSKGEIEEKINSTKSQRLEEKQKLDETEQAYGRLRYYQESEARELTNKISKLKTNIRMLDKELASLNAKYRRADKAQSKLKQLKPQVDAAIKAGLIEVDESFTEQAGNSLYDFENTRIITIGEQYRQLDRKVVKVIDLDIDLKTAKVEVLYTKDTYSTPKVGEIATIAVVNLYQLSSFTEDELSIKNKLRQRLTLKDAAALLNRSQLSQYLKSGELDLDGGIIIRKDGVFKSLYSERKENADFIVYPSPADKALKKELAQWLLQNRNELASYGAAYPTLEIVYGEQVVETVESYGNQASTSQIQKWVEQLAKTNITSEMRDNWLSVIMEKEHDFYISREIRSALSTKESIPSEYANRSAFVDAADKKAKQIVNEVMALATAKHEELNILIKAKVSIQDGKSNTDVMERLKWLANSSTAWGWDEASKFIAAQQEGEESPYLAMAQDDRIAAIYSDLKRCNQIGKLGSNIKESVIKSLKSFSGKREFTEGLSELALSLEPTVIETARAEKAAELVEKIEATKSTATHADGITVKLNEKEINVDAKKYKSKGRWRSSKAVFYPECSVYCVHDTNGTDGALYANRNALKEMAGKGNYQFATDLNDDYPDAWWFFDANAITLEQINEILEA